MEKPVMEAAGQSECIQLFEDRIVIKGKTERYFWLDRIASVRFKPATGMVKQGYIQFLYPGQEFMDPHPFSEMAQVVKDGKTAMFTPNQQTAFEQLCISLRAGTSEPVRQVIMEAQGTAGKVQLFEDRIRILRKTFGASIFHGAGGQGHTAFPD